MSWYPIIGLLALFILTLGIVSAHLLGPTWLLVSAGSLLAAVFLTLAR